MSTTLELHPIEAPEDSADEANSDEADVEELFLFTEEDRPPGTVRLGAIASSNAIELYQTPLAAWDDNARYPKPQPPPGWDPSRGPIKYR